MIFDATFERESGGSRSCSKQEIPRKIWNYSGTEDLPTIMLKWTA
jgi:hypothetical protein